MSEFITVIALLVLYFLPTIVSAYRHHHQHLAIGLLNLFTGWTALGWVAALVWAATATPGQDSSTRKEPSAPDPAV